ncbi:hypothetical protein RED65_00235 [Oceanobacter sp. RED65]|uniref:O-antigen ligase-related domain-containing protein n=1 Tax=Bermanella marisrubri TaxID=207949 RepID=Q1N4G2_9GAMM|nr:hypothetical protein RED65_00235 [Oceanobacter sp. RED65] [Bermanella marisrubri]
MLLIALMIGGLYVHSISFFLGIKFHHLAIVFAFLILCFGYYSFKMWEYNLILLISKFYILLIVLALVSSCTSVFGIQSVKYTAYLLIIFAFSLVFVSNIPLFLRHPNIVLFIHALLFSLSILIYLGITHYYKGSDFYHLFHSLESRVDVANTWYSFVFPEYGGSILRFNGYNLDPNVWGVYALFAFWFLVVLVCIAREEGYLYSKKLFLFTMVLSVISLVLTFSRGTYVAFFLSLFVYFSLTPSWIKKFKFIFFSFVFVSFIMFLYVNEATVKDFVDLKLFGEDVGDNPRILKWSFYLDRIWSSDLHEFLFGVGLIDLFDWFKGTTMHNTYLQIFLSFGLIGFFIFLLVFFLAVLGCIRSTSKELLSINFAMLSAISASVFFVDMMYSPVLWIGLAFPTMASTVLKES